MPHLNVEIKARCPDPAYIRKYLLSHNADFLGIDQQTDTYFNIQNGRLKLRSGNIENNLIYYQRPDLAGPKHSNFYLTAVNEPAALLELLAAALGIKVVVAKKREIYYLQNVKFHIDKVDGLGTFIEIEAGNMRADLTRQQLLEQCEFYMKEFSITVKDLVDRSYSDLLLEAS